MPLSDRARLVPSWIAVPGRHPCGVSVAPNMGPMQFRGVWYPRANL